jgi:hypothetical protein
MMTVGLIGDFENDTRMLGNIRRKVMGFWDVSVKDVENMDVTQKIGI